VVKVFANLVQKFFKSLNQEVATNSITSTSNVENIESFTWIEGYEVIEGDSEAESALRQQVTQRSVDDFYCTVVRMNIEVFDLSTKLLFE